MPQGLSNTPATFNRCVTNMIRPVREFAPSYFDDVSSIAGLRVREVPGSIPGETRSMARIGHGRKGGRGWEVHKTHVRQVLTLMRKHKLHANLKKCISAASLIPLLGCIVSKLGVRPDPEKIKAITDWPVPVDVYGLKKFLGLAPYLHKYSGNYAEMTVHLSRLLEKDEK